MDLKKHARPEPLMDEMAARCAEHGSVEIVRLFCRQAHPEQTFCMVKMSSGADRAAEALGAFSSSGAVVCQLYKLEKGFSCPRRIGGVLLVPSCDDCSLLPTR